MSDITEIQSQDVPCFDPECDGIAEPEIDGEHAYYTCQSCGSEFGYERVKVPDSGTCAIGVPETIRKLASAIDNPQPQGTPVSIGRKKP